MDQMTHPKEDSPDQFNIREIIEGEWLEAHFQPIISLKRRRIVALEGLIRGIHPVNRFIILPADLYHEANVQDLVVELDCLCRKKVMEAFKPLSGDHSDALLSINLSASVLDQGEAGLNRLRDQVKEMGLHPENIAIEIIESRVKDLAKLQRLVQVFRSHGFLIALDDVGVGHSNLNRVLAIKPDIIKIDRFLVENIHQDFYKQEVVKSLVSLGRRLGTLIVAEGAEAKEEAECLLDMDVDMIQGYYFSEPQKPKELDPVQILEKVGGLGGAFKEKYIQRVGAQRDRMVRYYTLQTEIQMELNQPDPAQFTQKLKKMLPSCPGVESLYVLDKNGIQISECVCEGLNKERRNSVIFRPSPRGTDHGMKDYFFFLMEASLSKTSFLTEPYLSMTTGNTCITLSSLFRNANLQRYILCMDINHQFLKGKSQA